MVGAAIKAVEKAGGAVMAAAVMAVAEEIAVAAADVEVAVDAAATATVAAEGRSRRLTKVQPDHR
jgi:hypothetical protein